MASTTQYLCLSCSSSVRNHHQAIECEVCKGWQHRGCGNTGISRYLYAKMKKGLIEVEFICDACSDLRQRSISELPDAESTRVTFAADVTTEAFSLRLDVTDAESDQLADQPMEIEETPSLHHPADESMDTGETPSLHLPAVPLPATLEESSIVERTELVDETVCEVPEFTVVPKGTSRGKDLLVETPGYSYTVRKETTTTRFWWCSVRRKGNRCPASVSERSGVFVRGSHNHSHPEDPACLINKQITRQVKEAAANNVFKSAMAVVEEHVKDIPTASADMVPRLDHLVRKANRFRQNQRPDDPTSMDFELAADHIPDGFLQKDLTVDGARHIIFATPDQLQLLANAKTWYLDGTFKVIRQKDVFDQLFGVHAFVKKEDCVKQVPLAFVFMSRRRKKDYKKVLKKLKNLLPTEPRVKAFVLDFEVAVWKAIRSVFPNSKVLGCAFHWTQAVWKRIQACGLATEYNAGGDIQKLLRRLLALPLLPAEHIVQVFNSERAKAANNQRLLEVFQYINDQWIENATWAPSDWSVYGQAVRTNNDCEGYHRRLNTRAQSPPPFYVLVELLHGEAKFVSTQVKLVSMKKLTKHQKKTTKQTESKIFSTWAEYAEGGMSAEKLLRKLSRVYSK